MNKIVCTTLIMLSYVYTSRLFQHTFEFACEFSERIETIVCSTLFVNRTLVSILFLFLRLNFDIKSNEIVKSLKEELLNKETDFKSQIVTKIRNRNRINANIKRRNKW